MITSQNIFMERLSKCLEDKGWSFSKLAKKTGTANSSFTRYKRGVRPDESTVQRLAEALGVSPEYLLEGLKPGSDFSSRKRPLTARQKSQKANEELSEPDDQDSTYNKDALSVDPMFTLSSQSKPRTRVELALKEIASRLVALPGASPKMKRALKQQINARIKEYERICELEDTEKRPHN